MNEIEKNKHAWSQISEDHYNTFLKCFQEGDYRLNHYIVNELGDITGKKIIHLQCNTGADTIQLSRMGASSVVGVDLVPENIHYANTLANGLNVSNVSFIESDIMHLSEIHKEKYDIVFTSEGVLGWLPDLNVWAKTISSLLNENGFLYVFDSHPTMLMFDESVLYKDIYNIKYPYFSKSPDYDTSIGGYASDTKDGVETYFWMHTVSDIINSVINAGMKIEFFNEYAENYFDSGNMKPSKLNGLYCYDCNVHKYPMSFSMKALV